MLTKELKEVMLAADKKAQELHGATPCIVWRNTQNNSYDWTCGEHKPDNTTEWDKVTVFKNFYLDNLYNFEDIENDFESVWADFIEYYMGEIDEDYNERYTNYLMSE